MLLATPYSNIPRFIPFFTIPALLLSFMIIIFPKFFRSFPYPAVSIAILSIVLPTLFLHLTA